MLSAAAWVLLPALLVHATPLAPPVPAALETPTDLAAHTPSEAVAPPEKRLLKYFLPSTHSWVDGTGLEGTKRGYNKNYLRFGRSEDDKRAGRNFLRFGRGDNSEFDVSDTDLASTELEKRNRNFLRFGRVPQNFIRFHSGVETSPLAYSQDLEKEQEVATVSDEADSLPSEEKRARALNYLRFGRSNNKNFLRFGRSDNRNFLRFGRSVDRQLPCEDCQEETMGAKNHDSTLTSSSSSPVTRAKRGAAMAGAEEHDGKDKQRSKRSAPNALAYYDYVASPSHGPISWARTYQPEDEELVDDSAIEDQGSQMFKRGGYNRSFLRFGRNRNFLRFGKRDGDYSDASSSSSDEAPEPVVLVRPAGYPRDIRGVQRNFLRFG